jgi:hypothetical protein
MDSTLKLKRKGDTWPLTESCSGDARRKFCGDARRRCSSDTMQ